jgi:hypothetical protein
VHAVFVRIQRENRVLRKLAVLLLAFIAASTVLAPRSAAQSSSSVAKANQAQTAQPSNSAPAGQSQQSSGSAQPAGAQPVDKNSANQDPVKSTTQEQSKQGKVPGTSKDRLLYTLPNFLTLENAGKLPPMPVKDKFKVVALSTFDPVNFAWWGLLSGISQGENSEPAFGQGWASYGKRYGTQAGDSTVENFMVGAVFPSVLHQDPRFYQSSQGGFGRRAWYAGTRIFVTRGDSVHKQFNFSEIFGAAFAAAISTYSYHPKSTYLSTPTNPHMFVTSDRTLLNTTSVWGTQVGLDTITYGLKEFWPDIRRKVRHQPKAAMTQQNANSH